MSTMSAQHGSNRSKSDEHADVTRAPVQQRSVKLLLPGRSFLRRRRTSLVNGRVLELSCVVFYVGKEDETLLDCGPG
jgi:hypothetical protein